MDADYVSKQTSFLLTVAIMLIPLSVCMYMAIRGHMVMAFIAFIVTVTVIVFSASHEKSEGSVEDEGDHRNI